MNRVSELIFDTLAQRRSIVLRGIGTLDVKRRKAKQISETEIIPPQNVVLLSGEEREDVETAVSLLASEGGMTKKEAKALYDEWFVGARGIDGSVEIDRVGDIRDGKFFIASPLHVALNPSLEDDIVTLEPERKRSPMWIWWLVGGIIALLLLGALWGWKNGYFDGLCSRKPKIETVAPVATEPVGEESMESANEGSSLAGAASSSEPRFHVIAGAFAIESNADNFMARIRRDYPELTVEKIINPSNGYNMVSIFSAPTQRQAYNKMNQYWDIDLFLWIYEQR